MKKMGTCVEREGGGFAKFVKEEACATEDEEMQEESHAEEEESGIYASTLQEGP